MKEFKVEQLRNVGFIGHGSTGKTSLTEAIMYTSGAITRAGKIEEGTTVLDFDPDEITRKISINTAIAYTEWKSHKINLIDTPGYADFIGEVKSAIRAFDIAVVVVCAVNGIEVGTETVWEFVDELKLPRVIFVNKLDKENTHFYDVVQSARERFGLGVVPLQIPLGEGTNFKGLIDVIKMRSYVAVQGGSGKLEEQKIPDELKDSANEYREKLIEAVAESDDELINKFLEGEELTLQEITTGLRKEIVTGKIIPLLCGSVTLNIGISCLLDTIVDYLPSPSEIQTIQGKDPRTKDTVSRTMSNSSPLSAFIFKTVTEPHIGELSYIRVYSGSLQSGTEVLNSTKNNIEKIGQIYLLRGKERKEYGQINAGEIGALVKLKNTNTGDTLCDKTNPVLFDTIDFPEAMMTLAVEPKSKGDEEKISVGLARLHEEDPTFSTYVDNETRQTIISGIGELHLDVVVNRLKRKFGVEVNLVKPKIPYKETIRSTSEVQGKYKRQSGGRGQYGDVWLRFEPLPRGAGFEFVDNIVGGVVPAKYIPAVEKGIHEAMQEGVLAGYPVIDYKVALYDGSYHSVDSSDIAFKIAASMGFKKGIQEASPVLLEPIMAVEVILPEEFMGDVMGDLNSRRGKIQGMSQHGKMQLIRVLVPLAEMHRYATTLRSLTQGRGKHRMKFSCYEEVPKEISDKIISEAKQKKQE